MFELLEFPCDYPLKVMGHNSADFRTVVLAIVEKHTGPLPAGSVQERLSQGTRYLSLTCTFQATSREQLDALYRELTSCGQVLIVL